MAAMKPKESVPEDKCDDAPPSYYSSATVPYAMPSSSTQATAVSVIQGIEVQRVRSSSSNYSCGNPIIEVAERIARILFILILITFAGLTITSLTKISFNEEENVYNTHNNSDNYDYETFNFNASLFLLFLTFCATLCCIIGSLLCDIPVIILQFVLSTKIVNQIVFRVLDIIKWILLTIGFVVVFIITEEITSDEDYTGSVITTLLVFCGITIAMGVVMTVWNCSHLFVSSTTHSSSPPSSSQVVTLVPVNSTLV